MPPVSLSMPMMPPMMPRIMPVRMIHSRNWVRATRATPMILPNISSVDLTEETSTSTTRLDFSSMTLHRHDHVDLALGDGLLALLVHGVGRQMDVGMDVLHDLLQAGNVIGVDTVGLHGVVDAVFDEGGGFHAHRLVGIGRGRDRLGGAVQRRDAQEDVRVEIAQAVLHVLGISLVQLREGDAVRILQGGHHDAGVVDDGDPLGIHLGAEHDEDHHGVHAREQDRNAESSEQERLLLDLVQVFPLYDDA